MQKNMERGVDACQAWKDCSSITHKHCVKNWRNLVRLWRAQKLCDVTINVNGKRFRCHGIVPASSSPFFRDAFLSKVDMSATNAILLDKEIIVDFMTEEVFSQVLNFMYTAEVVVSREKVRPLVLAAARLEMQGMVSAVMREVLDWEVSKTARNNTSSHNASTSNKRLSHLSNKKIKSAHRRRHQTDNNCVKNECCRDISSDESSDAEENEDKMSKDKLSVTGIMDELRLQGDLGTLEFVRSFACRNFSVVSKLGSFLDASVHSVACLMEDDRLDVGEFEVFCALCRWLEAQQLHLVHAPYLLSKVRLQLLSPQELADHVETKDYLMRKKKCRVLILEAFRFHCLLAQSNEDLGATRDAPNGQVPRSGTDKNYDSDEEQLALDADQRLMKKDKKNPLCPVKPCSCCPDYILASGGIDIKQKTTSEGVYKYEERDNSWMRFSVLPEPRNHHATVYCKGSLYLMGGSDPSLTGPGSEVCPVSTCHRLGLGTLKWCKIESMSTPRMSMQAVFLNEFIYAVGGQDHKQRVLRDVERYSLERGTWEYSGTLSSARAGLAVCAHRNRIWVLGGYCHKSGTVVDTVERFNQDRGSWEPMTPLRFPRCFANAAVCQGRLHILGGAWLDTEMDCGNFSSVYDVDVYNDANEIWEGVTALRVGRHDAGLAVLGPRIYIIGGKHCDNGVIKNLDTIECFDVEKEDWLNGVTPLPLPLLGPSVTFTVG